MVWQIVLAIDTSRHGGLANSHPLRACSLVTSLFMSNSVYIVYSVCAPALHVHVQCFA